VLVDFWEYTCINCLRTLPYVRAWYERYHNDGLVIVGVHTPEFGFSGDRKNVAAAVGRLGVAWPVVLDTNDAIWRRYGNSAWPQEYLFDQDGKLVDETSGEGQYQETETKIQSLLKARNPHLALPPVMALLPQDDYTKPGAVCYMDTPEILFERTKIANADKSVNPRRDAAYTDPGGKYADGSIYLQGSWHMTEQAAVTAGAPGYLVLPYQAIQVVGVMAPPGGAPVRVDVTQDGAPIAKGDAGADIHYDAGGAAYVTVDSSRAYELLMNAKMAFHNLRLTPQTAGLGVYSFAFESCEIPKS
jgi:thiol-disulfide isomerase/thioredoxin